MKKTNKILSVLLVFTMMWTYLSVILSFTNEVYASSNELESQDKDTGNSNVEFDSYFDGGVHSIKSDINSQDTKIHMNIKVKNAGYLKDAKIKVSNANFVLSGDMVEGVQSIDTNSGEIALEQINNGDDKTYSFTIYPRKDDLINVDNFVKENEILFEGTYINKDGEEEKVQSTIKDKIEWNGNAKINVEANVIKNIPFSIKSGKGEILQVEVKTNVVDNLLPIKTNELNIVVPMINNILPDDVNVMAKDTIATNGKDGVDFTEENYSYDKEKGILNIKVENNPEEEKIDWRKNEQDEFIITYVYNNEEVYNYMTANETLINSEITSNMSLYNNEETKIETKINLNTSVKEQIGDIVTLTPSIETQTLSKAYIYANYDKSENKEETNYTQKYRVEVAVSNIIDELEINEQYDAFIINGEQGLTTVAGTNYAYNKKVYISEKIFNKILGENGYINLIDINGNTIGTINKDTQRDENGNMYIDISGLDNNMVKMQISKPITEGNIDIFIDKAIKGEIAYSKEQLKDTTSLRMFSDIKVINNDSVIAERQAEAEKEFIEPKTTAEIEINNTSLSSIVTNEDVEIKAILRTDSVENALFKNPTIRIDLPEYIENINVKNVYIAYDDELKITEANLFEENGHKVIEIRLEGTQTKYNIGSVTKGTNIVIVGDITVKKLTPTVDTEIKMTYTNENSTELENIMAKTRARTLSLVTQEVSTKIQIVAPTGLVTVNEIQGFSANGTKITSISGEEQTGKLEYRGEQRTAKVTGTIINNYENDLNNVRILGRLPVTGVMNNTFDAKINSEINLTGANATIYYSTKADATDDIGNTGNGWTTTFTAEAKSYLIVIDGNVTRSAQLSFTYDILIPADLDYYQTIAEKYSVMFNNLMPDNIQAQTENSPLATLTTGEGVKLEASLAVEGNGKEVYRTRENIKYIATIKNTGNLDAENAKITFDIPEGMLYMEYDDGNTIFEHPETPFNGIDVGLIKAGETKQVTFYLQVNVASDEETTDVKLSANITADKLDKPISTNEVTIKTIRGQFEIMNRTNTLDGEEFAEGARIIYEVTVRNYNVTTQNEQPVKQSTTNTTVTIPLPKNSQILDKYVAESGGGQKLDIEINESNNTLTVNLGTLEYLDSRYIYVEYLIGADAVGDFNTQVSVRADGIDEHYSNNKVMHIKAIDLELVQNDIDKEYVKEREVFKYKFTLTNLTGTAIKDVVIEDIIPKEVIFDEHLVAYQVDENGNTIVNPDTKEPIPEKILYIYTEDGTEYNRVYTYNSNNGNAVINLDTLDANTTVYIELAVRAGTVEDDTEVTNYAKISANGVQEKESNKITHYIEYTPENHGETPEKEGRYKITGTAWLDADKNGQRDDGEELLSNIRVMLMNVDTNQIAVDADNGEQKIVTTNSNGKYEFSNLLPGRYIVIFVYDASKYSITDYKKENVSSTVNSDAILMKMDIDGKLTNVGATDTIVVTNENIRSMDIGLYEQKKFDLKLEKYITKITVQNNTGTKTYDYGETQLAKRDLIASQMNNTNLVVEYKIKVINEGQLEGYAKKIIDYLPKELKFSTELNPDWYLGQDGNIYNASLADTKINPGETKEITLILTKATSKSDNLGLITNKAELYEVSNDYGVEDIDSTPNNNVQNEDDTSIANLLLSPGTGRTVLFVVLTTVIIIIIGVGVYFIKKKVIK